MAARPSGGENRLVSLPLSRIRVIMKSSPEVSSINQDALFLTARATVPPSARPGGTCGGVGGGKRPLRREAGPAREGGS